MEQLEKVQHIPMKDRERLPWLQNDRSVKRLDKSVDPIIKVVLSEEPDLTTINQLQYMGTHLIYFKIVPRKPRANIKPGGSRVPKMEIMTPKANR